jgi:hypothetical protein
MESFLSPSSPRSSSTERVLFPPGGKAKVQHSRWREFNLAFYQVLQAIAPKLSLSDLMANWQEIAERLAEPPRHRSTQEKRFS